MANMNLTKDFAEYSTDIIVGLLRVLEKNELDPQNKEDVELAARLYLEFNKLPFEELIDQATQCLRAHGQTVYVDGFGYVTVDAKQGTELVWPEFKKAFGKEVGQTVEQYAMDHFDPSFSLVRKALGPEKCKELGIPSRLKGDEAHMNDKGKVHQYATKVARTPSVEAHPY